jgi:hypothetical protein
MRRATELEQGQAQRAGACSKIWKLTLPETLQYSKEPARGTSPGRYLAATSAATYKGSYDYIPSALPLHRSDEVSPLNLCLPHTASKGHNMHVINQILRCG